MNKTTTDNDKNREENSIKALDELAKRLENTGVAEYVKLQQKTGRILLLNFLSGIARGLGFTVGTAVVLALLYKLISHIISMNIPIITEALNELVTVIQKGGQL